MVPNLLVKLRQGLQVINYPEERIPVLFDALVSVHERAFEEQAAAAQAAAALALPGEAAEPDGSGEGGESANPADADSLAEAGGDLDIFDNPDAGDPWLDDSEANESGYVGAEGSDGLDFSVDSVMPDDAEPSPWSVADLAIGSWVELRLDGIWVRAQLTWASPHLTLFMFVSGRGLAHSMSRRTMDRRRAQGLIRVVSNGDVVGSALDAVAQTALRNNQDATDNA